MRLPCLLDAVTEEAFTVSGVFGGTLTTERMGAVRAERRQAPDATESEVRARAVLELESTFESRTAIWEHMASHGVARAAPRAGRRTVAVGVAWT